MVVELKNDLENEIKQLSTQSNCTVDELLNNIVEKYLDDLCDRELIEKAEKDEKQYGTKYFTIDESDEILARYERGEITEQDLDNL